MTTRPAAMPGSLNIFATCPQSAGAASAAYRARVQDTARWAEDCGCKGILVYADNSLIDPWLVSQIVVQSTAMLSPLVAVQPVYMHPYTTAKMVASLAYLYGRQVYLNMIAGGFKNDLAALDDSTPHDERYDRLVEYTSIVLELTRGAGPVSFRGKFYRTQDLKLTPPVPRDLQPGLMISGSSAAGAAAARALGAISVEYPRPVESLMAQVTSNNNERTCTGGRPWPPRSSGSKQFLEEEFDANAIDEHMKLGIRIGIISRATDREAWDAALSRFPEDRKGKLLHQYAMKVSDSAWHQQLSDLGSATASGRSPYWLGPFENYKTFCPYLVGSYEVVGMELSKYIRLGYRTFILDIPVDAADLMHSAVAFAEAVQSAHAGAI